MTFMLIVIEVYLLKGKTFNLIFYIVSEDTFDFIN